MSDEKKNLELALRQMDILYFQAEEEIKELRKQLEAKQ